MRTREQKDTNFTNCHETLQKLTKEMLWLGQPARVSEDTTRQGGNLTARGFDIYLHPLNHVNTYDISMKSWIIIGVVAAVCVAGGVVGFQFLAGAKPATTSVPKSPPIDLAALRSKAEAGDAAAEAQLGNLYAKGEGVTNSYAEAAKWFTRAADQTNSDGLLGLGELCEAGQGVPKDLDRAVKLYHQSAELGNADGQYTLAFMYESGRGVRQSHVEAAKWYQRAAEQGQALAQYDLGQRYNLGVGVPVDKVEALKWLMLAANQGQPDAATLRDKVKRELSGAQVGETRRRVDAFVVRK